MSTLQYITDDQGSPKAVVVPFAEWTAIIERIQSLDASRNDTEYLLASPEMKQRLLQAKKRMSEPAKSWEEVRDALNL